MAEPEGAAPAPDTPLLALEGVRIRARGAVLIEGLDLDLSAGEFVTLMGPSGPSNMTVVSSTEVTSAPS